jgi:hypothetical protein
MVMHVFVFFCPRNFRTIWQIVMEHFNRGANKGHLSFVVSNFLSRLPLKEATYFVKWNWLHRYQRAIVKSWSFWVSRDYKNAIFVKVLLL